MKALIVDDEFQSRSILQQMMQRYFPEINLVGQAASVEEGLFGIQEYHPDILFLDVQMRNETGFDLLNRVPAINFSLIFITAFDKYAIQAFRFNAIDYLLKPIVADELIEAINRVKKASSASIASRTQLEQLYLDIQNPEKIHDKIAIPTPEGFTMVPVNEIVYCHADSNYTEFYLTDKRKLLSSYTLKQYDEILTRQSFFRVHRSYLINLAHIKMYRRGEGGEIVMSNNHEIELSRARKDEFLRLLNIR